MLFYIFTSLITGLLLESNTKIRDVYVFKRGYQCPVLKIEDFGEDYVLTKRQQQVLSSTFT